MELGSLESFSEKENKKMFHLHNWSVLFSDKNTIGGAVYFICHCGQQKLVIRTTK